MREVDRLLKDGYTVALQARASPRLVDADLQAYFDTIPHDRLMARVETKVSDGRVLDLIRGWLKGRYSEGSGAMDSNAGFAASRRSAPPARRAVISPLLANIYLDPLDKLMAAQGYRLVRYADDFVVLCQSRADANTALAVIQTWVSANGLTLHPEKTPGPEAPRRQRRLVRYRAGVGDCRAPGQGFEFLGYRFEAGQRRVRKKSLTKLKDSIRAKTGRSRGDSLVCVIADLNPSLRGWFVYFKQAHYRTFGMIDSFVRRRLRALLRKQQTRPGLEICQADHQSWPNATSRMPDCSHFTQPGKMRDTLDEETTDWRAVCGKTARTVRREGWAKTHPYPYRD